MAAVLTFNLQSDVPQVCRTRGARVTRTYEVNHQQQQVVTNLYNQIKEEASQHYIIPQNAQRFGINVTSRTFSYIDDTGARRVVEWDPNRGSELNNLTHHLTCFLADEVCRSRLSDVPYYAGEKGGGSRPALVATHLGELPLPPVSRSQLYRVPFAVAEEIINTKHAEDGLAQRAVTHVDRFALYTALNHCPLPNSQASQRDWIDAAKQAYQQTKERLRAHMDETQGWTSHMPLVPKDKNTYEREIDQYAKDVGGLVLAGMRDAEGREAYREYCAEVHMPIKQQLFEDTIIHRVLENARPPSLVN